MRQPCTWRPCSPARRYRLPHGLKDQPPIITTTICPTRSVLTVPDGPGRRIEIDDDALQDLDLSCELATALSMNGRARPASPDPGHRTAARGHDLDVRRSPASALREPAGGDR